MALCPLIGSIKVFFKIEIFKDEEAFQRKDESVPRHTCANGTLLNRSNKSIFYKHQGSTKTFLSANESIFI